MKVKEVIKELEKHDPEMLVVIPAYEEDWDTISDIIPTSIHHKPYGSADWSGDYAEVGFGNRAEVKPNAVKIQ